MGGSSNETGNQLHPTYKNQDYVTQINFYNNNVRNDNFLRPENESHMVN